MINTKGIMINRTEYRETSLIVKFFTTTFGLKSYIISDIKTRNRKYAPSLFHHLNILDLSVYNKKNKRLHYISEAKQDQNLYNIYEDDLKRIIAQSIADILNRTLKEDVIYENIFSFLRHQIIELNDSCLEGSCTNTAEISRKKGPLPFLNEFIIELSNYLGFGISNTKNINEQLSQANNCTLNREEEALLTSFLSKGAYTFNKQIQSNLLHKLISYYSIHFPMVRSIKSIKVLELLY